MLCGVASEHSASIDVSYYSVLLVLAPRFTLRWDGLAWAEPDLEEQPVPGYLSCEMNYLRWPLERLRVFENSQRKSGQD